MTDGTAGVGVCAAVQEDENMDRGSLGCENGHVVQS